MIGCYINKARKCGSLSRKFGKWDRRYLHFSLEDLELLYSNQPDDKVQNSIPLEKVLRVRQDTGFSKKGKCIILYCTTRVFFFQFYDMLNFNKFLLFMGYIRHKRDHLPFYIHAVSVSYFTHIINELTLTGRKFSRESMEILMTET